MKKIIFLDFDGVLNTEHYQNYLMYERKLRMGTMVPTGHHWLKMIFDKYGETTFWEPLWYKKAILPIFFQCICIHPAIHISTEKMAHVPST